MKKKSVFIYESVCESVCELLPLSEEPPAVPCWRVRRAARSSDLQVHRGPWNGRMWDGDDDDGGDDNDDDDCEKLTEKLISREVLEGAPLLA